MERGLLDSAALFLLPFLVYAVMLTLRRRYPFALTSWTSGPVAALVASGLALVVAGILLTGYFAPRYHGAYVPAHLDHGRLVPGHME